MTVGCNILRSSGHNKHRSEIFSQKYPNLVHSVLDKIFVQHKNPTTNCLLSHVTFTLHLLLIWADCQLQVKKEVNSPIKLSVLCCLQSRIGARGFKSGKVLALSERVWWKVRKEENVSYFERYTATFQCLGGKCWSTSLSVNLEQENYCCQYPVGKNKQWNSVFTWRNFTQPAERKTCPEKAPWNRKKRSKIKQVFEDGWRLKVGRFTADTAWQYRISKNMGRKATSDMTKELLKVSCVNTIVIVCQRETQSVHRPWK